MKLTPSTDDNGTSKLCYMLSKENLDNLRKITPEKLEAVFGKTHSKVYYEPEKGYEDPEWYFETECGAVVGVGFRWGTPRFRAKNVSEEIANQFLSYINFRLEK